MAPADLAKKPLSKFKLLIVLDEPAGPQLGALTAFEQKGGKVSRQKGVADPNGFALEMRRLVGREHRVIDIWNGITVLTAPYAEPQGDGALVTVLNYAHQPLPVQLRIAGKYRQVQFETPEEPAVLLPHQHREAYTEFVLPALRIGGRVFLSR
jgi:hypothetical protein